MNLFVETRIARSAAAGNCLIRPLTIDLAEGWSRCVSGVSTERMIPLKLEELGWNGFFASQDSAGVPARVASAIHEQFLLWTERGELEAGISGGLRHTSQAKPMWPAVGDWVALRSGAPVIESVFKRQTALSRKQPGRAMDEQVLAANIGVLFIVSGLDHDYNERRLERYLVVARQSGAQPVILLNKADLANSFGVDLAALVPRLEDWSGVPVFPVSAASGEGLGRLAEVLRPGEAGALIGSSGVGKSTIVNRLLGTG